jgi:hypothetical protein
MAGSKHGFQRRSLDEIGETERMTVMRIRRKDTSASAGASAGVALGLSSLVEGFGQAYNRQPLKAVAFGVTGLTLSTASGLNTWLVRNVLGMKGTRIGPERVRPGLLALWAATFALNLVDAWRSARQPTSTRIRDGKQLLRTALKELRT